MKEHQTRQGETLKQVAIFCRETTFTNPRVLHLKDEILSHDARVRELVEENRSAKSNPVVGRKRRHISKDMLREHQLLPLSRRGRKLTRANPELEFTLKVPHKNASVAEIADAADRIADALTPHLNILIEAKFPRNCLTTLRQDAQALREYAEAVETSRSLLGRSNRALTEELAAARETIDELDAVLRSLDDFKTYEFGWNECKRVGARMGRPSKRRLAARKRSAAKHGERED